MTWHVEHPRGDNDSQGPRYYAEQDYIPVGLRLMARVAPRNGDLKADIRVDGVSIFTTEGALLLKEQELDEFPANYLNAAPSIDEGAVVTFHLLVSGGAEGVTAQLELDSEGEESE